MNKLYILAIVLISGLFITQAVKADIGPKPQVDIVVIENGIARTDSLMKVEMLGCRKSDSQEVCKWETSPLYWFQGCSGGVCHFTYFLPDHFKLAYQSHPGSNKIFSNDVPRIGMKETYTLRVNNSKAVLSPGSAVTASAVLSFGFSAVATILIELSLVYVLVKVFSWPAKAITALLIGNAVSLPLVWITSIYFGFYYLIWGLVAVEIAAVLIEWSIYIIFLKRDKPALGKLFLLALGQNLLSYFAGGFIKGLLMF